MAVGESKLVGIGEGIFEGGAKVGTLLGEVSAGHSTFAFQSHVFVRGLKRSPDWQRTIDSSP
jgi:hypothetical protein